VALRRRCNHLSSGLELGAVDERKKLLVVDDDRSLAAQLVMEADAWDDGYCHGSVPGQGCNLLRSPHVVVLNLARLGQ